MNALETNDGSSCWNSDQAPPTCRREEQQIYTIHFQRSVRVRQLKIMFQGGFVPQQFQVFTATTPNGSDERVLVDEEEIYEPNDSSKLEDFPIEVDPSGRECCTLKLVMGDSNDFYGRMTIYRLEVWGYECEGPDGASCL
jgi:hypothetical protein